MAEEQSPNTTPAGEHVINLGDLAGRALCKKRYGRARLTIRRWGGLDDLFGERPLAQALAAFRTGEVSAEDVAWAFVRARIESHSPSFCWQEADLTRLIDLVTDCSELPRFSSKTPEALAKELVKAQDDEREQLKRISEQLSRSFAGVERLSRTFNPPILRWAEQQRKTVEAITRGFAPPLGALSAISTPTVRQQVRRLGLTANVRREMFPTFLTMDYAAAIPTVPLLSQRIRLPNSIADEMAKSLNRSLSVYQTQTVAPALNALTRQRIVSVDDVLRAAGEAATIVEEDGDREDAEELRALSGEVAGVAEEPTIERVEQMVSELSERIEERFDDLENQINSNEERRQSDRRDDLTLNLYLWFLAIYFAFFVTLLDHLS